MSVSSATASPALPVASRMMPERVDKRTDSNKPSEAQAGSTGGKTPTEAQSAPGVAGTAAGTPTGTNEKGGSAKVGREAASDTKHGGKTKQAPNEAMTRRANARTAAQAAQAKRAEKTASPREATLAAATGAGDAAEKKAEYDFGQIAPSELAPLVDRLTDQGHLDWREASSLKQLAVPASGSASAGHTAKLNVLERLQQEVAQARQTGNDEQAQHFETLGNKLDALRNRTPIDLSV